MESMTRAPYLLPGARAGYRLGDQRVVDSMMHDGLFCAFDHVAMGMSADVYSRAMGIARERQDALAAQSHERAAAAVKAGKLAEEIVPISVPQRKGDPLVLENDEGVRPETTLESLAALRPAFSEEGTVTAGNASQISDGAAAVIVMSPERADELGITPLGEIIGYGQVAGPDASLLTQPSHAIREAVARAGLELANIDLFEISEAFAAVQAASTDDLKVPADVVNVNGGAIALGHPIGMSGTRLAITMLYELRRRGGGVGAVGLCGGGGQGDAAVLRVIS
jgi:acetyl-CoA C-acetyltransferase